MKNLNSQIPSDLRESLLREKTMQEVVYDLYGNPEDPATEYLPTQRIDELEAYKALTERKLNLF